MRLDKFLLLYNYMKSQPQKIVLKKVELAKPTVIEIEEAEILEVDERKEYNCTLCKGEGLLNEKTVCSSCSGTGKS